MSERVPDRDRDGAPDDSATLDTGTWESTLDSASSSAENPVAHALSTGSESPAGRGADMPAGASIARYQLRDELGRGGMGVVYLAHDPKLNRDVALKVVRGGKAARDSQQRRFSREARAVARLKHANIVEVYDMGTYHGGVYYTMEYVQGTSLARRIAGQPIEPREAARLATGIARALACAHEAGLIHRDVKPGNVLLDGDTPKLTDFGLVKQLDGNEATAVLTRGDQMLGTPAYMAPEQLAGDNDAVVPATDQYALGIVLFEMLSGQRPFVGVGSDELVHRMTTPEPPRLPLSGVPRELDLIRRRAMAFATDGRYPSCAEMADDLQRFLEGAPVRATSPGLARRARWLWRRYWRRAAVAAVVVAAILGGVQLRAAWSDWQRERAQEHHEAEAEDRRQAMETRVSGLRTNGDQDAADRVFQSFMAFEGNRGTRALGRAQLERGRRLRASGQSEQALDTLAAAYASTDEVEVRGQALIEIAEEFRAHYRWAQLAVLLDTMSERTPAALAASRMNRVRLDSALAGRDISRAAELAESSAVAEDVGLTPLLAHLAQATATEHHAQSGRLWDMDGDGQSELVLHKLQQPHYSIVGLDSPSLPVRQRAQLPPEYKLTQWLHPLQGVANPTLLMTSNPRWVLASTAPNGPSVGPSDGPSARSLSQKPFGPPTWQPMEALVSTDLDRDGQIEHHAAMYNELAQLVPGPDGGWSIVAHDEINGLPRLVRTMIASDLDRDGQTELIVGSRGWYRYDVQVFRAAPDKQERRPGFTPLVAGVRRQLGAVIQLAVLDTPEERLLAALQAHDPDEPLSRRIFPAGSPQGEARGIHLLALVNGQWQTRDVLPLPDIRDKELGNHMGGWKRFGRVLLETADLDGDGRAELILGGREHGIFIYQRAPDGQFRELVLIGVGLLALVQVDDDPMPELVVNLPERDDEVWVLGVGTERLPLRPVDGPAVDRAGGDRSERAQDDGERHPVVRHELGARWQRAEDLHAIGLDRAAVDQLREVATLAVGTVDEGRALYRAGQILLEDGAFVEAGALFATAAASDAVAARAWEAAMAAYLADMRWQEAEEAAKMRLDLPDPPESVSASARVLHARLTAPTTRFDFRDGLDPAWRVATPLQVRTDQQGRGLRITGLRNHRGGKSARPSLVELPMTRTGELLRIAVEFELERIDWASYFLWYLSDGHPPVDGARARAMFNLHFRGGGGVYDLVFRCLGRRYDIPGPDELSGHRLRIEWQQTEDGAASCELTSDGAVIRRIVTHASPLSDVQGPVTLLLEHTGAGARASAQVLLLSAEMTGFATTDEPPTPLQRVHRELALGRPDAALSLLQAVAADEPAMRDDPTWQLARAVVAEALDDPATAHSLLRSALRADSSLGQNLDHIFRHELDRFEEPLRAILGDRYYIAFADAVLSTVRAHGFDGRMLELLRDHLDGLEDLPLYPAALDSRSEDRDGAAVTRIDLQVWRARAWRLAGRPTRAMRTLYSARMLLRQLDEHSATLASNLQRRIDQIEFSAGRELASCYLARGERDRAMDALFALLLDSRAPEVTADRLVARGEFQMLRKHPRWQELERIRGRTAGESSGEPSGSVPSGRSP